MLDPRFRDFVIAMAKEMPRMSEEGRVKVAQATLMLSEDILALCPEEPIRFRISAVGCTCSNCEWLRRNPPTSRSL